MIELKNLVKRYNPKDKNAVDNLSLEVAKGEIFGFIGPNGAGKTTTIKMMTGLLTPTAGTVSMNGFDIIKNSVEAKKSFGFVPDTPSLFEKIRGIDYLNFVANVYEVSLEDRHSRIDKYSKSLGLDEDLGSLISSYSHGMKQKLAVIGVLVYEPKIWILDEPLVGLDPQSAFTLKELMKEHAAKGNTVFFSSHILEVVEKLCHRVGIVQKGKLIYVDTLENMRETYKDMSLEDSVLEIMNHE